MDPYERICMKNYSAEINGDIFHIEGQGLNDALHKFANTLRLDDTDIITVKQTVPIETEESDKEIVERFLNRNGSE